MSDAVKHMRNPDVWILRNQMRAQARKELPTLCPHPIGAVEQYIDEEPGRAGRPTNLFQCSICSGFLCLTDFHGREAADG